jgi:membrane-associated protease RseP (regulator of RpoE activity)
MTLRGDYVHERENKLEGILHDAGLTFEVLSKMKLEPVVLFHVLKDAGVTKLVDCINIIAAIQQEDRSSFNKVLHARALSNALPFKAQEASVELVRSGASV